ncbi:VanZ family protein [Rheinheimera sp. UJ51]|uniref:VanZ family protein n=1 Tax=unclassified Rheinheimera TaxID=115860 RepID=UPI001E60AE5B|nr:MULTISPECIES: VanZ family protein [unclassified Rheinheimera]MCC5450965.1 VanZ family protein [Rheinheimera sp. UJ51]MCF4007968.1 VanZ family protein [Rheinheimera sp. UJ63]
MPQSFYRFLFLLCLLLATFGFMAEINGHKLAGELSFFKIENLDKVAHFGIFFVLSGLIWKGFRAVFWKILLLLAIYGALIEVIQENYTRRTGDFWDWVADMAGVLTFFVVRKLWHLWRPRSKR